MNPLWNNPVMPPEPLFGLAAFYMAVLFALTYIAGYTYAGGRRAALVSMLALVVSYPVLHSAGIGASGVHVSILVLLTLIVHSMSKKPLATGACVLSTALACSLSPQAVALPLLLILCDWSRGRELFSKGWQKTRYAACGAVAIVCAFLLTPAIPVSPVAEPASAGMLALNGAKVYLEYLSLWAWPFQGDGVILPLYTRYTDYTNLLYWVILALVLRHTIRLGKRNRWLPTGLAWTLLTLVPACGFWKGGGPVLELEYLVLPVIGLSLMLGHSAERSLSLLRERQKKISLTKRVMHGGFVLILALWLGGNAFASIRYMSNWGEPLERLEQATFKQPGNYAAATELARLYSRKGDFDAADELILKIQDATPWYREIYYVQAEHRLHVGGPEDAASTLDSLVLGYFPDETRARQLYDALKPSLQELHIEQIK